MVRNKTTEADKDVLQFINEFEDTEQKRKDSHELIKLMQSISGHKPKMWGPSIIGFGNYHYKYASRHEGDAPMLGFSPRKAAISLYVYTGLDMHKHLLEGLGKFKLSKVCCIYIKKLSDIDQVKLKVLMQETIAWVHAKYPKV